MNLQDGKTGLSALGFRSNLSEYAKSGGEGALVGVSYAAGGPLLAGLSSGTLSASNDLSQGKSVDWTKAAVNASITSFVGYGLDSFFPKVAGRAPNLFTEAFFSGKHTQNELVKEGINIGVGLIKESISSAKSLLQNNDKRTQINH